MGGTESTSIPSHTHTYTHQAFSAPERSEVGAPTDSRGEAGGCLALPAVRGGPSRAVPGERAPWSRALTRGRRWGAAGPAPGDLFNPRLFFTGAGKRLWLPRVWERGKLKVKQ